MIYKVPNLAVDALIRNDKKILLIKRKYDPFKNHWAFPGGFVDYGENPIDAVKRELREETSLVGTNPKLFGVYGDPKRDPRKHVVSIVYTLDVQDFSTLKASDDAKEVQFFDIDYLKNNLNIFAFDHSQIFLDYLK